MKLLILISFAIICYSSHGQKAVVHEENFNFSASSNVNSLSVEIPYAQKDFVDSRLKKLLKGWGSIKRAKENIAR